MKNKNYIVAVFIIIVITIGTFLYFYMMKTDNKINDIGEQNIITRSEDECDFKENFDVQKEAVEKDDVEVCFCIKEREQRDNCVGTVIDVHNYNLAVKYLKAEYCKDIIANKIKESCQAVVASGLKQVENYEK